MANYRDCAIGVGIVTKLISNGFLIIPSYGVIYLVSPMIAFTGTEKCLHRSSVIPSRQILGYLPYKNWLFSIKKTLAKMFVSTYEAVLFQ